MRLSAYLWKDGIMKIVDIKSELSEIVKMPVEAYLQRKVHLQEFIKKPLRKLMLS